MISSRLMPITCVLVAVALVPTLIHSYADTTVNDGRTTAAVSPALAGFKSTPTSRHSTWGQRRFDSSDWLERTYTREGKDVQLTIVRTYDLKAVYHHPELAVAYGTTFEGEKIRRFPAQQHIPVHVLTPAPPTSAVGMYVLLYDDRFVESAIPFQIRTAGELLFSGRKPMTLFFALGGQTIAGDAGELLASDVLFGAIDSFRDQVESPEGSQSR